MILALEDGSGSLALLSKDYDFVSPSATHTRYINVISLEEKAMHTLGLVVIDELHLLGDASRGYLLELSVTKIQYMCQR